MPYLFCLPFPNRASDFGDLYIGFNRNHLTFPVALLVFQVETRFNHSFPNHAYASHIASRISYHVLHHVVCALHVVDCVSLCLCSCLGRAGRQVRVRGPVEYVFEDQGNSENFAGKMTIPSKSLLSLLASCSLYCYAYATIPTTILYHASHSAMSNL